ncbi:hypothetical protein HUO09_17110 [Vibrio sp. Y2-5]|uniref:hypothetical protein n=1 Tax=Vibrio sp. Y2-5 TaxID=2743977 RepID=UPI0016616F8B|nr:hypothetical protein [Vibrio sp. Y2-5]MBD0788076.1 hypothetical protein [Vibrio sp. Y2-5]
MQTDNGVTLVITTFSHKPNIHHKGWVDFTVEDPSGRLKEYQINAFEDLFLTDELLEPLDRRFINIGQNGGVFPYDESFGGLKFQLPINEQMTLACIESGDLWLRNKYNRVELQERYRENGLHVRLR